MNKYLSGFVALCVLPVSAFAEESELTFDDGRPVSKEVVREYKTEKAPIVVYRQKDTPVSIVISKYGADSSKEVSVDELAKASNEEQSFLAVNEKQPNVKNRQNSSKDIRDGRWYVGLNGDLSFLSWKNRYSGADSGSDRYAFKHMFGADAVVGYNFNENWRVDGELGYIGKYTDKETEAVEYYIKKSEFSLQTYYMNLNAYCDIAYGLYAGFGAGFAIVDLSADDTEASEVSVTNLSPMGAIMFGWTYALDEKIDFDVRYRFSAFNGGDLNIGGVNVDTGLVLNNSLSVGVKYYF